MNHSLNTFTVVLLAFPFFLAQRGRLAAYIALAKPTSGNTAAPATAPATTAASSSGATSGTSSGMDTMLAVLPEFTALFS